MGQKPDSLERTNMMHFQGSHFFPDTVSNCELSPKRFAEHGVCSVQHTQQVMVIQSVFDICSTLSGLDGAKMTVQ
jgi:hypothetical protein